jgi:hypothetical protein
LPPRWAQTHFELFAAKVIPRFAKSDETSAASLSFAVDLLADPGLIHWQPGNPSRRLEWGQMVRPGYVNSAGGGARCPQGPQALGSRL